MDVRKIVRGKFNFLLKCVLITGVLCSPVTPFAAAQAPRDAEYKVKAAYIYNFCRYIEWPSTAFVTNEQPLVIGVIGGQPFGSALDAIARKTINGRAIVVYRLVNTQEAESCHVLFIAGSQSSQLHDWAITRLRDSPTLVIGETASFATDGGDINFYLDNDGTVGFQINVDAVQNKQLKVSSRLARLAEIIRSRE